jgi:hypothetical protein
MRLFKHVGLRGAWDMRVGVVNLYVSVFFADLPRVINKLIEALARYCRTEKISLIVIAIALLKKVALRWVSTPTVMISNPRIRAKSMIMRLPEMMGTDIG